MKYIINRILNAVLLSFMASFGFLVLGLLIYFDGNAKLFEILNIVIVIFLILLLVFGILFFTDKDIDFIKKEVWSMNNIVLTTLED